MTLPQHETPASRERRGQAPYNFVPLPEAIFAVEHFQQHDRLDTQRLHGFIDLAIATETEVYTRCAYPPQDEARSVQDCPARQDFYHSGDASRPVIPGASLRGMVRSLVEILSYSRMTRRPKQDHGQRIRRIHRIRDERLVHRAVADQETPTGQAYSKRFLGLRKALEFDYPSAWVRAGYLEEDTRTGGWAIRPARRINGVSFVRVKLDTLAHLGFPVTDERDPRRHKANAVLDVWVKPEAVRPFPHRRGLVLHYARTEGVAKTEQAGTVRGKLIYSGEMRGRHMHTVIYEPDRQATPIPIPEDLWVQFREDRDQQRGIPCRKIGRPGDPLFFLVDTADRLEFLGPTIFFRLPYTKYTADYLPQATVDADGPPDLAEAIFGTVSGGGRSDDLKSYRGRVNFDDATWSPGTDTENPFLDGSDGRRWPAVLSAPKPTSFQNYLVQTDPEGRKDRLSSYAASTPDERSHDRTALRGFKLYWHRGSAAADLHIEQPPQHIKQYTKIRPVRPGVTFTARVRFENLSAIELGALLAALELPATYRHRLGMGKPLGMGSVQVQAATILVDPLKRYRGLGATGRLDPAEQETRLSQARDAFRTAMIRHHNACAVSSQIADDAGLWDIPRLHTLGLMLDWENRPNRDDTAYLRDLKAFRDRRVLPTPAGVRGEAEAAAPQSPAPPTGRVPKPRVADDAASIAATPALSALQAILKDERLASQKERLAAVDDALLDGLAKLDEPGRRLAWRLIHAAIGQNRKTRERLKSIQARLTEA